MPFFAIIDRKSVLGLKTYHHSALDEGYHKKISTTNNPFYIIGTQAILTAETDIMH